MRHTVAEPCAKSLSNCAPPRRCRDQAGERFPERGGGRRAGRGSGVGEVPVPRAGRVSCRCSAAAGVVLGPNRPTGTHGPLTPRRIAWVRGRTGSARGGHGVARPAAGRLRDVPRPGPAGMAGAGGEVRGAGRPARHSGTQPSASPPPGATPGGRARPADHGVRRPRPAGRGDVPGAGGRDRGPSRRSFGARGGARDRSGVAGAARADPVLVTTVPVDPSGGGGLTGLVLSPSYAEDQLVYAYDHPRATTVWYGSRRERPRNPCCTGIPRGPRNNGGALGVDVDGSLLVATGDAGGDAAAPGSLAGKLLRVDTLGRPPRATRIPSLRAQLRAAGAGRDLHRPE